MKEFYANLYDVIIFNFHFEDILVISNRVFAHLVNILAIVLKCCMSKESWPNLYTKLLYEMGQYFLEQQYVTSKVYIIC